MKARAETYRVKVLREYGYSVNTRKREIIITPAKTRMLQIAPVYTDVVRKSLNHLQNKGWNLQTSLL